MSMDTTTSNNAILSVTASYPVADVGSETLLRLAAWLPLIPAILLILRLSAVLRGFRQLKALALPNLIVNTPLPLHGRLPLVAQFKTLPSCVATSTAYLRTPRTIAGCAQWCRKKLMPWPSWGEDAWGLLSHQ